jgi:hypothetical protein
MKRNTKWQPTEWVRLYKGRKLYVYASVLESPTSGDEWTWYAEHGADGSTRTFKTAMRAAEKAVDAELRPTGTSKEK